MIFTGPSIFNEISDEETNQAPLAPVNIIPLFDSYHGQHNDSISSTLLLNRS